MSVLNARIKREWHPPKKSESLHVKVHFTLNHQGEMSNLFLSESSHDEKADQAALAAVKNSSPFMPLPAGTPEFVEIEFDFHYNVDKRQNNSCALSLSDDPAKRAKNLAFRYLIFNSYPIALESFDKAISLNQQDGECLAGRADTLCHLKRYDQALLDCEQALKLDPRLKTIYLVKARCYSALGQHFKALKAIDQAMALNQNSKNLLQRASIYSDLGQYGKAVDDLSSAIKINYWSKDSEAVIDYSARGDAYGRLGLFDKALNDYERAFAKDPRLLPKEPDHFRGFEPAAIDGFFSDLVEQLKQIPLRATPLARPTAHASRCELIAFKDGPFYGYKNKSGQWKIEPTYLRAEDFHEGLAAVLPAIYRTGTNFQQKWGYIDSAGNCQVNPEPSLEYDDDMSLTYFSCGLAMHRVGPRCGFIDSSGKLVIHPLFDQALPFCQDLAAVKIGGKFGFIDKTGKFAVKPQFDLVGSFSDDLAPAMVVEEKALIRKYSQTVAPDAVLKNCQYGYINKRGEFTGARKIPLPVNLARLLSRELIPSFDQNGRPVFKPDFNAGGFQALVQK